MSQVLTAKPSSLWSLSLYFLRLGSTGFGGPIALAASMREDLVDRRGWFTEKAFEEGMALSQLAPGPLATQLAIYFGWAHSGVIGATVIGIAFIIPSFLIVLLLSVLYIKYESLPWLAKAFYGIGACVIAIISVGAWKLGKKTLKGDKLLWIVAIVNGLITAYTGTEIVWVFLFSGFLVMMAKTKYTPTASLASIFPVWMVTGISGEPANFETLKSILIFFLKAGTFVFGSGLAIVPFLHGGVVNDIHWLTERQFLDAVAVAMITPGPVVITVAFIGFLVAGFLGSVAAATGVFIPCYLFTVVPAPYFSKFAKNKFVGAFVTGVTAAAVGAIIGAVFVLGRRSLVDVSTVVVFLVVLFGLIYIKKIPEPIWILAAGGIGLFL